MVEGIPEYFRILGRTSVDIIKSGGYKISALGVENVLLAVEGVQECAVLGLPDAVMGELVAAVVAFKASPVQSPRPCTLYFALFSALFCALLPSSSPFFPALLTFSLFVPDLCRICVR